MKKQVVFTINYFKIVCEKTLKESEAS